MINFYILSKRFFLEGLTERFFLEGLTDARVVSITKKEYGFEVLFL